MEHANNSEKPRYMLAFNNDVIDRARAAGINLDAAIEQLDSITYHQKSDASEVDVAKAYKSLFYTIRPLLAKYNIRVQVAFMGDESRLYIFAAGHECEAIFLNEETPSGKLKRAWDVGDAVPYFDEPVTILQNLIMAVSEIVSKNREIIKEIDIASHFVRVLANTNEEKGDKN